MNLAKRIDVLELQISKNEVIRRSWRTNKDGVVKMCPLRTMYPNTTSADKICKISDLPHWFAHLIPRIADMVSEGYWPTLLSKLPATLRLLLDFTPVRWDKLYADTLLNMLRKLPAVVSPAVREVTTAVIASIEERVDGWQTKDAVNRNQISLLLGTSHTKTNPRTDPQAFADQKALYALMSATTPSRDSSTKVSCYDSDLSDVMSRSILAVAGMDIATGVNNTDTYWDAAAEELFQTIAAIHGCAKNDVSRSSSQP